MPDAQAEVAIVGGGPVGTLLAGELALHGVRTVVLEQLAEPNRESKAGTLHAHTAQLLHRRGLLEAVQPGPPARQRAGRPSPFHFAGIWGLDLAPVVDEGPPLVGSPQAWAQEVFTRRAEALGAQIRRGVRVTEVEDHGESVRIAYEVSGPGSKSSGPRELVAGWVVGTDGARSTVRKSAGIGFAGTPATLSAIMGEVRFLEPHTAPRGYQRTPHGWTLTWLNPSGHSRVITYDFRGPAADRQAPVTFEELRAEVERIHSRPVPMDTPRNLSRFSDAALQATHYRQGRVLLAGDAAHVHFPAGGQGLGLGLQDAINLGWKLAAEVVGWAPDSLLDNYHDERHPAGARVLQNVRAQVALMNPDPAIDPLRELFADLMRIGEVNDRLAESISGTRTAYGTEPSAGRLAPDLRLKTAEGDTTLAAELHAAKPLLLDFADSPALRAAAAPWTDRVRVLTATTDQDLRTAALLVRPDGYTAWSGQDPVLLAQALRRWIGGAREAQERGASCPPEQKN